MRALPGLKEFRHLKQKVFRCTFRLTTLNLLYGRLNVQYRVTAHWCRDSDSRIAARHAGKSLICLASHTVQHCWRQQQHLGREGACRQPNSV